MEVRFGKVSDLKSCVRFENLSDEKIIQYKLNEQEIVVAEANGEIVGYLRLEYLWSKIPYIALIKVQESLRGKGTGRAIIAFLEKKLAQKGHGFLLSSSQADEPAPQAWHRAIGFVECGVISGINDGGIGEIFFRKDLSASEH